MTIATSFYSVMLSSDYLNATLVSKNAARKSVVLQNQHPTAVIYISNSAGKRATECLALQSGGNYLRDVFVPSDDIYAWSDTPNVELTVVEGY